MIVRKKKAISSMNEKIRKVLHSRKISYDHFQLDNDLLLTDVLLSEKIAKIDEVKQILEETTGYHAIDPMKISFSNHFIEHIRQILPYQIAKDELAFPMRHDIDLIHIAFAIPNDISCIHRMEAITGTRVKPYCSPTIQIKKAIQKYYLSEEKSENIEIDDIEKYAEKVTRTLNKLDLSEDYSIFVLEPSVIILLRLVLNELALIGASDIHFEPNKSSLKVRCRKDGVMQNKWTFSNSIKKSIILRLKSISGMDIKNDKQPKSGSINFHVIMDRDVDIRVSALPSLYGEKIVLRLLYKNKKEITLQNLGMENNEWTILQKMIRIPSGMIIVTGPTGSGKTTTLYSILNELKKESVNILTAEDPIEYIIDGITQTNCSDGSGISYKEAIKTFLRQDPDIIMLGEIRDEYVAETAIRAAMTGHIVLSTLHTIDAPSSFNRLINMGIPAYLCVSTHICIIAQRLIRKICTNCKEEYTPGYDLPQIVHLPKDKRYYIGIGCNKCSFTGYDGVTGIFELLTIDENMIQLILDKKPSSDLRKYAIDNGMTTLRESALKKLFDGVTTIEEVLRLTI